MQIRQIVGFHRNINEINFLLLYEATLFGKWLQTFRQTVRDWLWKGQMSNMILPVEYITKVFLWKVRETNRQRGRRLNTPLVVSRTRWAENVSRMTDKNYAHKWLAWITKRRHHLEEIRVCVDRTIVLMCVLKLWDIGKWPVEIDSNAEANIRPFENGNVYLCVQKTIKVYPFLYNYLRRNTDIYGTSLRGGGSRVRLPIVLFGIFIGIFPAALCN